MKTPSRTPQRLGSFTSIFNRHLRVLAVAFLACPFLVSCDDDAIRLRTHLAEDETIEVGDPVLNSDKETIGIVTGIEEKPDKKRVAVVAVNPVAVGGTLVRIEGSDPIELVTRTAKEGQTSNPVDGDFVETQSRTEVVLDQIIPDNITTTKVIYLAVAICVMLLVLLFVGKALVRAGAAIALLVLSLLAGWIGTGFATPVVASWLEAHPPAELITPENGNLAKPSWLDWIPENPDPAWVTFIAITCLSYLLFALVTGFVRRVSSTKAA